MTDEQIKYMTERFLTWKLPMLFAPDGGITFEHFRNVGTPYEARNEPTGTNLLHAGQAEAMIRHLVAGLPEAAPSSPGDGWEAQLQHWYADPFGGRPIWRDTPSIWNGQRQLGYREIYVKKPLPAAPSPGGDHGA